MSGLVGYAASAPSAPGSPGWSGQPERLPTPVRRDRAVEFVAAPADRPYGVEAIAVDPSGNKLVVVEQHMYTGEDFPHS